MATKKILCVCIGNSDRSPAMAAVLGMYLKKAGHDAICESAGIGESAESGGPAAPFAVAALKRIGLDISGHKKRRITLLDLDSYDLIICVNDEVAGKVIEADAALLKKIYNAQVTNPWPCQFQEDYDSITFVQVLSAMYRVVSRYFP